MGAATHAYADPVALDVQWAVRTSGMSVGAHVFRENSGATFACKLVGQLTYVQL